ncbi:MAG: hypothetical protein M0P71_17440 [Melioribacteraceae bacterium]|nr:hypothetical protein [Melioribacteraceae bacterium]
MKMTFQELINAWNSINQLATNADIPSRKASYAISRMFDILESAIKPYNKEAKKFETDWNDLDADKKYKLKEGKTEKEYEEAKEAFLSTEVEVNTYELDINELKDVTLFFGFKQEKISILPIHYRNLKYFITGEPKFEPEKKPDISPVK